MKNDFITTFSVIKSYIEIGMENVHTYHMYTVGCPAGEYLVGGACRNCSQGTFKTGYGDDIELCKDGLWAHFLICNVCNGLVIFYIEELCAMGHGMDGSTCTKCPVGFYKSKEDKEACKACPAGRTTKNTGASDQEDCSK